MARARYARSIGADLGLRRRFWRVRCGVVLDLEFVSGISISWPKSACGHEYIHVANQPCVMLETGEYLRRRRLPCEEGGDLVTVTTSLRHWSPQLHDSADEERVASTIVESFYAVTASAPVDAGVLKSNVHSVGGEA